MRARIEEELGLRVCLWVEGDKPVHAFTLQATTAVKASPGAILREKTAPSVPTKRKHEDTHQSGSLCPSVLPLSLLSPATLFCLRPPNDVSHHRVFKALLWSEWQHYRWGIIKRGLLLFSHSSLREKSSSSPERTRFSYQKHAHTFLRKPLILPLSASFSLCFFTFSFAASFVFPPLAANFSIY